MADGSKNEQKHDHLQEAPEPLQGSTSINGMPEYRYDIFICYGHDCRDFARMMKRDLEEHGRGFLQARRRRVFLDDQFGFESDLGGALTDRIDQSSSLLHIASPGAAKSQWVERELRHWFETRADADERFLLVLAKGDINFGEAQARSESGEEDATSPVLRTKFSPSRLPLYSDMRDSAAGGSIPSRKIIELIAHQQSQDFEEIYDEEERAQNRRNRIYGLATATAIAVAIAALLAYLAAQAATERANAEADRSAALSLSLQSDQIRVANPALALALSAEAVARADPPQPGALRSLATSRVAVAEQRLQAIGDELPGISSLPEVPVAFGGDHLAVAGADAGRVLVLRMAAPNVSVVAELSIEDPGLLNGLSYSSDGRWLVAYGSSTMVWQRDSDRYVSAGTLETGGAVEQIAFDEANAGVALRTSDHSVTWWTISDAGLEPVASYSEPEGEVLALSDDGTNLLSSSRPDTETLDVVWQFDGSRVSRQAAVDLLRNRGPQPDYRFSADGSRLLSQYGLVWRRGPGGRFEPTNAPPGSASPVIHTWSDDGRFSVAFNQFTRTVQLWDLEANPVSPITFLSRVPSGVDRFDFSGDGTSLIFESTDGTVEVWGLDPVIHRFSGSLRDSDGGRWQYRLNPAGSIVVGFNADSVRFWEFVDRSDTLLTRLPRHFPSVENAVLDTGGQRILSTTTLGKVHLWTETDGRWEQETIGSVDVGQQALWVDGTGTAVTVDRPSGGQGTKRIARVWPMDGEDDVREITLEGDDGGTVAFSGNGSVAWGDGAGGVHVITLGDDEEQAHVFAVGQDSVRVLTFDQTGSYLAAASQDGAVVVFDLEQGTTKELGDFAGFFDAGDPWQFNFDHLGFSPDGKDLVVATSHGWVRVRDWASSSQLEVRTGDAVVATEFTGDGGLVVADRFGMVHIWYDADVPLFSVAHRPDAILGLVLQRDRDVLTVVGGQTIRLWWIGDTDPVLLAEVPLGGEQYTASDDGITIGKAVWDEVLLLEDLFSTADACERASPFVTIRQLAALSGTTARACLQLSSG